MSWSKHQPRGLKQLEAFEHHFLFGRMSAGCKNQRHSRSQTKTVPNLGGFSRQLACDLRVELQITRSVELVVGHAECLQSGGIGFRLHHGETQTSKQAPEKERYQSVPAKGLSRNPSIHERDRNAPRFAFAQEVWPKLSFHDQHRRRIDLLQCSANGPAPVERKVEDALGLRAKNVAREILAGKCDRRNDQRVMRKLLFDSLGQRPCGLSLTDRNTVQPDDGFSVCGRKRTEALA